jgi:HSP20 family molecular chaperone IbpA
MAKKSKITGIEALFAATTPEPDTDSNEHSDDSENTVRINFELPESLKKEIKIHCIQNRISMKDFITIAIKQRLK